MSMKKEDTGNSMSTHLDEVHKRNVKAEEPRHKITDCTINLNSILKRWNGIVMSPDVYFDNSQVGGYLLRTGGARY